MQVLRRMASSQVQNNRRYIYTWRIVNRNHGYVLTNVYEHLFAKHTRRFQLMRSRAAHQCSYPFRGGVLQVYYTGNILLTIRRKANTICTLFLV